MSDYDNVPCSAFVSYVPDVMDQYILGTTFMRNFYITFDYLDSTMTFTSKWSITKPKSYLGMSGITVVIVIVGICVLLAYIGVMIFCCVKNKRA